MTTYAQSLPILSLENSGLLLEVGAAAASLLLVWSIVGLRAKTGSFEYLRPASTLPVIHNMLDVTIYHGYQIYDWFTEQSELMKRPWLFSLGTGAPPTLVLSTPELFEDVLKTQFEIFPKGDFDISHFSELLGNGIFASDGDAWYFHRKTASNLFSHQMIRDVMYESVRDKCGTLLRVFTAYEARGEPTSVKDVFSHFTSDVFSKIAFGLDFNFMDAEVSGEKRNEFAQAFTSCSLTMAQRFVQPGWMWRTQRALNIGLETEVKSNLAIVNAFVHRVIHESIAKKTAAKSGSSTGGDRDPASAPKDLISLFLDAKVNMDLRVKDKTFESEMTMLRDTVINYIFAGKVTTSQSLAFFIVMMNRHPAVLKQIRAELQAKLPRLADEDAVVPPTLDELTQLTYLEAAIRENVRLNPAAPLIARKATKDTVLSDGTPVPKGMRVAIVNYALARNKTVWGEDASEYKPERWIDPTTGKLITVSPYKFTSFLSGPRQCIGMKFALLEMKCTLAVVLSRFDLKTVEDPWTITYEAALTMMVKGPLMATVSSRTIDRGPDKLSAAFA